MTGLDSGNMEAGMDPHGPKKTKANSSRVDNLRDWERAHKPGIYLTTLPPKLAGLGCRAIPSGQRGSWCAMRIGGPLVSNIG